MLLGSYGYHDRYAAYVGRARDERARVVAAALRVAAAAVADVTGPLAGALWNGARRMAKSVRTAQRRRAAINELERLDDRILADIGLSRSQIPFAVERQLAADRVARQPVCPRPAPAWSGDRRVNITNPTESLGNAA